MEFLHGDVGRHGTNWDRDVKLVQGWLNRHSTLTRVGHVVVDGYCGPVTQLAIAAFQREVLKMTFPTATVQTTGVTVEKLQDTKLGGAKLRYPWLPSSSGPKAGVPSSAELIQAAKTLECEPGVIYAIESNETKSTTGFDSKGRPTILFEPHKFHVRTKRKFDKDYPKISTAAARDVVYGSHSSQYPKLEIAFMLDPVASLDSTSWGAFQIMGLNHSTAGYASAKEMVVAMTASVSNQLNAFVNFVMANPALRKDMQKKNWVGLAIYYNGPGYAVYAYDIKLEKAYKEYKG